MPVEQKPGEAVVASIMHMMPMLSNLFLERSFAFAMIRFFIRHSYGLMSTLVIRLRRDQKHFRCRC